jgi:hypothetical protein
MAQPLHNISSHLTCFTYLQMDKKEEAIAADKLALELASSLTSP